jgi:short-subunit dehydrogenase
MGSYVAAKWGQLGLVRTLQQETRDEPGISISVVQPGGVDTPIYFQAASWAGSTGRPPPPVYAPQRVARVVVSTLDRPRRVVQAGLLNPLITAGFRLLPGVYDHLVGPLLRRLAVADDDVPPTEGNVFRSKPERNATEGGWRSS